MEIKGNYWFIFVLEFKNKFHFENPWASLHSWTASLFKSPQKPSLSLTWPTATKTKVSESLNYHSNLGINREKKHDNEKKSKAEKHYCDDVNGGFGMVCNSRDLHC